MEDLLKRINNGTTALLFGAASLNLAPEVRLKPLPPTGVEGQRADAAHIGGYWRAVGADISEAIKKYERQKK